MKQRQGRANLRRADDTEGRLSGGYTLTAIALHWLTAVMAAAGFVLGLYMVGLVLSPLKLRLFSYHKWIGVTVFILAVSRLLWRAFHPAPELPAGTPVLFQRAARAAHALLYVLIAAVPVAGWLMSSAKGFQTVYMGVLPIPDAIGKNKEIAGVLETAHYVMNKALLAVVLAHAAAALKHHFMDKDDVLRRMLRRTGGQG